MWQWKTPVQSNVDLEYAGVAYVFMQFNLDLCLLRTLIAIADTGGFARAGVRLHLTQAAVSTRMRKLEEQLDEVLFRREGRRMMLTPQAELLAGYGRKLLAMNDEAAMAVKRTAIEGRLRIGAPEDLLQAVLPMVLRRFAQGHPKMSLYVRSGRNSDLVGAVKSGDLDLAMAFSMDDVDGATLLKRYPIRWLRGADFDRVEDVPLPLVLFETPCMFREFALRALEGAGVPWRASYTASSVAGVLAAVKAGLGVTARVAVQRDAAIKIMGRQDELPPLPKIGLWLCLSGASQTPAAEKFKAFLQDELASLRFS